jgi:hypothetical protein
MITLPRFASPDPTQSRLSQPQVVFKNYHSNHRNEPSLSSVRLALRKASTYKSACSIRYSHPPEIAFRTVVGAPANNKPRLVSFVNQFCEPSVITSNTRHLTQATIQSTREYRLCSTYEYPSTEPTLAIVAKPACQPRHELFKKGSREES